MKAGSCRETPLILCITGMPGAGKSTVASVAAALKFTPINLGDFVRMAASEKGIQPTARNLRSLMVEMRKESGASVMGELAAKKIAAEGLNRVVIDGVRSVSEVEALRKVGLTRVLAVHASREVRFGFLRKRGRIDAPVSKTSFDSRDKGEVSVGIGEAIALADGVVSNNDASLEEIRMRAKEIFERWIREFEHRKVRSPCAGPRTSRR